MANETTSPTPPRRHRAVLRHGLAGEAVLAPQEDPAKYRALQRRLMGDLAPEGALEEALVEQIAAGLWRLARAWRIEASVLTLLKTWREKEVQRQSGAPPAPAPADESLARAFFRDVSRANALERLGRWERRIELQLDRALRQLLTLQARRRPAAELEAHAVAVADALRASAAKTRTCDPPTQETGS